MKFRKDAVFEIQVYVFNQIKEQCQMTHHPQRLINYLLFKKPKHHKSIYVKKVVLAYVKIIAEKIVLQRYPY